MTHAIGMKKLYGVSGVRALVPWFARLAISAGVLSSLTSCESGIQPQLEPRYLLYAAMHGVSEGSIAVIDCATDSVIDSVTRGFQSSPGVVASPDGKYFAVLGSNRPPEIFEASSRTQITYLAAPSLPAVFLPSAHMILAPDYDSTRVYTIPGFEYRETWPRPCWLTEPAGSDGRTASLDSQREQPPRHDLHKIVVFDPNGTPVDSFSIKHGDTALSIGAFTFSPNGNRFYALAYGIQGGPFLAGYDVSNHSLLFLQPAGAFQHCRVSPDGLEVWTTDHGDLLGFAPDWHGRIDVYDASTGFHKDTVPITGYYADPNRTLAPSNIRFLPGSDKVYVNSVAGLQPLLVINARTKTVGKLIFPNFNRWVEDIDLAPRP